MRRHSKLDNPLVKQSWKLNDFFQFCIIEESQASEHPKIEFFKSEVKKFGHKIQIPGLKPCIKQVLIFEID